MKLNYLIFKIVKHPLRMYFKLFWDLEIDMQKISKVKKPFILIANHVTNYDPVLINAYLEQPLHYVASDAQFRRPFIKDLLKLLRAIPKTKARNDLKTVRDILKTLKSGECVAIFPEGQRCWDGNTVKIVSSTASLIKFIKCPVVVCKITGGYLSIPRWAQRRRRGKVKLTYEILFKEQELTVLSKEEIMKRMSQSLFNSDLSNQEESILKYTGERRAEYIERLLYICPVCGAEFSIVSKGNFFMCRQCHTKSIYDERGFINFGGFRRLDQWTKFQKERVRQSFIKQRELYYTKRNVCLSKGQRMKKLVYYAKGDLMMTREYIIFKSADREIKFTINEISGENVQKSYLLEFYYRDTLYQVDFQSIRYAAYAWVCGIRCFKQLRRLNYGR